VVPWVAEVGSSVLAVGATRRGAGCERSRSAGSRSVPDRSAVAGACVREKARLRHGGPGGSGGPVLSASALPDQVAGSGRYHGGQRREPAHSREPQPHTSATRLPQPAFSVFSQQWAHGRGRRPFRAPLTCQPPRYTQCHHQRHAPGRAHRQKAVVCPTCALAGHDCVNFARPQRSNSHSN
jgi:hypothetical protein